MAMFKELSTFNWHTEHTIIPTC